MADHVVFVATSYPRFASDPAGHFVEAEALERARNGDRVTVLAPGEPAIVDSGPIVVKRLGGGAAFGWPGALARLRGDPTRAVAASAFVVRARRELERLARPGPHETAEHVVAHWIVPSAWPVALGHPGTLEVVAHGSDVRLLERLPAAVARRIVSGLLDRGARFRFVSSELRSRLARVTTPALLDHRVEPSPIAVAGVPSRAVARGRLGVPLDRRVAVVVGRIVASKRPVAAVRLALAHGAERVVVVGNGDDMRLARELQALHPSVSLTGFLPRDEALTWISAADFLVSASREEGAPTVIREARALGTAVVTVQSGDVAAWAAADQGIAIVP